ncbi:MAG TPA: DUF6089 family protein [Cytophagaceae bacterium]
MRLFIISFSLLCLIDARYLSAQNNEIGGSLGLCNYKGELSPLLPNPLFFRPGASIFYRRNFSPVVSIRLSLTAGWLSGNEKNASTPMSDVRNGAFSGLFGELAGMVEYNFLNYRDFNQPYEFTPYITTGLGLYNFSVTSNAYDPDGFYTQICLPIGMGFKYTLGKQWNLGGEFVGRRATDFLDGLSDNVNSSNKQLGDPIDADWYYYAGISISYTFYNVQCPGHHQFKK